MSNAHGIQVAMAGENDRQPLVVTDPRLLACVEDGPPDIGTLWELCMYFEYDRERTADGIATWLGPPDGLRVLDCACGSGFPALELVRRGYDVTATDGSALMLRHFRRNAAVDDVAITPEHLLWDELPDRYGGQFDVVINRGGGNYKYAGVWENEGLSDRPAMARAIRQWVACLAPGGRFYVDFARPEDHDRTSGQPTVHPTMVIGDHEVDIVEQVTVAPEHGVRTWHSRLTVDGTTHEFRRHSHRMERSELLDILAGSGLTAIQRVEIPGEFYDVYTATRDAPSASDPDVSGPDETGVP